jgi:hypothetical protein
VFEQTTHLFLNPVRTDRVEDFERFLVETVVPAVRAQRPELDGRWRVLKAAEPDTDDVVTYIFIFDGGTLDDWELDDILPAHYGADEAQRLLDGWMGTFAPRSSWAAALGVGEGPQVGWTFSTVL